MANREGLCTPLDVRNLSEFITTQVRDTARVFGFILREDPTIRASLRAIYPNGDTDLLCEDGPWNGPVQLPYPYTNEITGEPVENAGNANLETITPSSSAITEMWTITFTSGTAFDVYGSVSGSQDAGVISSDYDNGLIAIPAANWSGTPVANDQLFVSTYRFDPFVVALSAKLSAALAITSVNQGISKELIAEGREMRKDAMGLLKMLQRPDEPGGLRLGTFSPRDLSPEGTSYKVDYLGQDVSAYADNPRTPWVDSAIGGGLGFLTGPIWA